MRRCLPGPVCAALCVALLALPPQVAPSPRAVTTLECLLANSVFYHGKTVSVLAVPAESQGHWSLPVPAGQTLAVSWREGAPPAGRVEVRGLFFDVGRFAEDDSRLAGYGIPEIVKAVQPSGWPPRETLFVLLRATWTDAPDKGDAGLRAIALGPARYEGKPVTISGRFRGQNLYGDAPVWPRQSQWDFVLQSADAAIWVTGLRPRGKDFDFDPRSRRNTDSWLEVTGVLHLAQGLPYVAGQTVKTAAALTDTPAAEVPAAPALPTPAVIFSAPANGELDANPSSVVRVQFSRDMNAASFDRHITVTYGPGTTEAPPKFTVTSRPGNMAIEITFEAPLARFSSVTIELGEGITTRDGAPFPPTRITFTTGG